MAAANADWLPTHMRDDAFLLMSEFVTNAGLHGEPDIMVRHRDRRPGREVRLVLASRRRVGANPGRVAMMIDIEWTETKVWT